MTHSSRGADAALLAVAALWGGSYLAARSLTEVASVPVVLALRFVPAVAVLLAVVAVRRRRWSRRTLTVGLTLGAIQAVTMALETAGVAHTSVSNAGVLIALSTVFAPLVESRITGRVLPPPFHVAVGLGVLGVGMLVGPRGLTAPSLGDALILVAAVSKACLMVASATLTRGSPGQRDDFDPVALTAIQSVLCLGVFSVAAGPSLPGVALSLDAHHLLVLAFLSLGCTLAGFSLQLWGTHHTSGARAGLLLGTEPLFALAVGVVLAGEHLGPLGVAGAAVVVAATTWGQRVERTPLDCVQLYTLRRVQLHTGGGGGEMNIRGERSRAPSTAPTMAP